MSRDSQARQIAEVYQLEAEAIANLKDLHPEIQAPLIEEIRNCTQQSIERVLASTKNLYLNLHSTLDECFSPGLLLVQD